MLEIATIGLVVAGYGVWQYRAHQRRLHSIPIRIHVNGIRGKSSVTRLIAAGLRAGGIRTVAKTTGTLPRVIDEQGEDIPIFRPGPANILEQLWVVKEAYQRGAQALVMECMAVEPLLQRYSERHMVRSTIGVITNARADHLEVMGPTVKDVACALSGTTPSLGILFVGANMHWAIFQEAAERARSRLVLIADAQLPPGAMEGFRYVEHPENVALALEVCRYLGVADQLALEGMHAAHPDPGVLRLHRILKHPHHVTVLNALAANDPDSTLRIWKLANQQMPPLEQSNILLNTRSDRAHRSLQLADCILREVPAEHIVVTGPQASLTGRKLTRWGFPPERIHVLPSQPAHEVAARALALSQGKSLLFCIGNVGGIGLELAHCFAEMSYHA